MNKESQRKRLLAITIALVVLLVSVVGDLFITKSENASLLREKDLFNKILGSGMQETVLTPGNPQERILVLDISGMIMDMGDVPSFSGQYNHQITLEALENAKYDETIKGVLLAVDSPGGSVYHSEELHRKILELKEERPEVLIYSSMGSVAASGGYYISAPTDKIFAANETTTGSIGVIISLPNYEVLQDKIGIKTETFTSGPLKDMGSPSREMTDEERALYQESIDESFDRFFEVVKEGRDYDEATLRKIADGRTYSGKQALENGLIDEIGYYEDALVDLIESLELEEPQVFEISGGTNFYSFLNMKIQSLKNFNLFGENSELELIRFLESKNNEIPQPMYLLGGY